MNVLMGLIAGTVCTIGGAIKDTPHEGFKLLTFPRSIIAGLLAASLKKFVLEIVQSVLELSKNA